MVNQKVILIIMDGWGLGTLKSNDAIQNAKTPFVNALHVSYPHTTLTTCGELVGLPPGQMGNSEVGHLNLGAGRVVYQELERINVAIRSNQLQTNPIIINAIRYAKNNQKTLHLIGLVSDGGVHSHVTHLKALLDTCVIENFHDVLIHAFTDGRDTDPRSGLNFIADLEDHMNKTTGRLATITGRYYAMDRDKRWERVAIAYHALVNAAGIATTDFKTSIEASYASDITDEFILPLINANIEKTKIENGDAVFCFNFRTDRCREITEVLTQQDMPAFQMHKLDLDYTTMTMYDHNFKNIHIVFENDDLSNTLGEVLAKNQRSQLRIAETEKYPHVSFFFSGGREKPFAGENRIMIPSPKVATYDLQPEMSALPVTDAVCEQMITAAPDFICLNFANVDMVGHTGVWPAIIKAVETVDICVQKVVETALANNYTIFLTADHGNADYAVNEDGSPNTAHTLNLVPLFIIDNSWRGSVRPGKLGDIAPTMLKMMELEIPAQMTGEILIK